MTASGNAVKLTAKTALKGNRLRCIAACMTALLSFFVIWYAYEITEYVFGEIPALAVGALMLFFLMLPLFQGLIRFIWRMLFGVSDSPATVFYYFSDKTNYRRALKITFAMCIRAAFLSFLLFLPAAVVDIFGGTAIYSALGIPIPLWTTGLYYLSLFLKSAAVILLIFFMLRYSAAPVLFVADENMEASEAVHMSCVIFKSATLDFIYLLFGFFGWFLLSLTVIPLIFTLPYFLTSVCVFVRFAVADYNKRAEHIRNSGIPTFVAGE